MTFSVESLAPSTVGKPTLWFVGLGGVLTALAFPLQPIPYAPSISLWPVIFVSLAPFLARLMDCSTLRESTITALALAVPWFVVAGAWAFRMFDSLGWILIWLPVGWVVVFSLAANIVRWCGFGVSWSWPLLWIAVEVIRSEWSPLRLNWLSPELDALNFTWFGLGHPRLVWPPAAQSADLIGGYGLALAPFMTNLLLAKMWSKQHHSLRALWICVLGVVFADAIYCAWRWQSGDAEESVAVGVVQSERYQISVLKELTDELLKAAPAIALVVWPELAFSAKPGDQDLLHGFARQRGITLVTGVEIPTEDGYRNRAWWLPKYGPADEYAKQMRVPFVERHPSSQHCTTFPLTVGTRTVRVGVLICYDIDFAWPIRRLVAECGAELIAMPTLDDLTWGGTQHVQHALLPRLRAIENRRPIVQAATSGISQILDHRGQVLAEIPFRLAPRPDRTVPYLEGQAAGRVIPQRTISFYTNSGQFVSFGIAVVGVGLVVLAMGWQGLPSFRRRPDLEG